MGESNRKKRAHAAIFEACPYCIYCGGDALATTVEHAPPLIMFRGKRRPKGLEFPSCDACNKGTRLPDLVAAMIGRSFPDSHTDADKQEIKEIFSAISNNIPGLLQEMHIDSDDELAALSRLPGDFDGGLLRANGPLVSMHMQTFAAKMGFALYHEVTKQIVPKGGGVAARWFSNFERLEGKFPESVFDLLLPPTTLRQGRFEVSEQFGYQWRLAEGDRMGMFFAYFRRSFAVLAFVAIDKSLFAGESTHPFPIWEPGEITKLLQPTS